MIKVSVKKKNEIIITGHADYDEFGKDIVCSSASSIVITTINGIDSIDKKYLLVNEEQDKLTIKILKENDICYKLIVNMLNLLKELEKQYPKNVNVK